MKHKKWLLGVLVAVGILLNLFALSGCGDLEKGTGAVTKSEHIWDNGTQMKAPTCTQEGEILYRCTVCKKATLTETIEKLPHSYSQDWSCNETHHWRECACGAKADQTTHIPITQTSCKVCGEYLNAKYIVNYYLQNLEDDEYTLHERVELTGKKNETAYAEIKAYNNFVYDSSKSTVSGKIDADGSRVLSVYYSRKKYTVNYDSIKGRITNGGTQKCGKVLTCTAIPFSGYDFLGWYSGEKLLSTQLEYTFTLQCNVTAKFVLKAEMSNFIFESFYESCTVSGVKNKNITELVIPDYVTSIAPYAFEYNSMLKSVTLGKGVVTVGSHAFHACKNLKSVIIPNGVETIESNAFAACSSLIEITLPDSVTSVGNSAFSYCSSLKSVILSENITSIGEYTFAGCNSLMSVVIGRNVKSIGFWAFNTYSSLTSVYYKGTASEWLQININASAYIAEKERYYYSESEPTSSGNYWHYVDGTPTKW